MMRPGTEVDFTKSNGEYRYVHATDAGGCEEANKSTPTPPKQVRVTKFDDRYDSYTCPHCLAEWSFDKGAYERAVSTGKTPACPTCKKAWVTEPSRVVFA